ncbi:MAG: Rieske (2Fe-2S) protein [Phycisphaeraceae bacterium]
MPSTRTKQRHVICAVDELPPGERRIVEINGRSIGVFNVNGKYHAIRNVCPHQLAPLCKGKVTGTALPSNPGEYHWGRDGEIIRCPWHGWEFDLTTGKSVFNPHRLRVKSYEVHVEDERGQSRTQPGPQGDEPDPAVETFAVNVEQQHVVLYV